MIKLLLAIAGIVFLALAGWNVPGKSWQWFGFACFGAAVFLPL